MSSIKSENDFYVEARDGAQIFVRHAAPVNDNNKAVVIAHGIPGNPNEFIHMKARNFFTENGYHVYRMSFYDDAENARKLHATTLPLQANDLNDAVESVREKHSRIFVCSHSYGGATTIFANPNVDAIAFWDSSFYVWKLWDQFQKDEDTFEKELIGQSDRIFMLFSKDMMDHARKQSVETMQNLASQIKAPSMVITSDEDYFIDNGSQIYNALTCNKDHRKIKNSDHQFLNGHTVQNLLDATHNWFERF